MSIWQVVIASSKRVHVRVLMMTFLCVCIAMRVHLMCIRALHEQGVIRVLESLSRLAHISRVTVVMHVSISQV